MQNFANTNPQYPLSGRCEDPSNPCSQLCFNIHHDMYECDCREGFTMGPDGYNCLKGIISAMGLVETNTTQPKTMHSLKYHDCPIYNRCPTFLVFYSKLETRFEGLM